MALVITLNVIEYVSDAHSYYICTFCRQLKSVWRFFGLYLTYYIEYMFIEHVNSFRSMVIDVIIEFGTFHPKCYRISCEKISQNELFCLFARRVIFFPLFLLPLYFRNADGSFLFSWKTWAWRWHCTVRRNLIWKPGIKCIARQLLLNCRRFSYVYLWVWVVCQRANKISGRTKILIQPPRFQYYISV